MRVRVRGPSGQSTVDIDDDTSVDALRSIIAEKTGLSSFTIKLGYPPKPLPIEDFDPSASVSSLGLKLDGEQLLVSRRSPDTTAEVSTKARNASNVEAPKPRSVPLQKPNKSESDPPELPLPSHAGTLVLRIMPDDNSCLFRALGTAILGGQIDGMHELRSLVATVIQSQPDVYTAAVLEKDPDSYCRWIQNSNSWGGAIELSILSQHFGIEICSIDVQTLRVDRFNEGCSTRCVVVYSGIHYDCIALAPSEPPYKHAIASPEVDIKVFDSKDDELLGKAVELCRILQGQHYYTDTAHFSIKCNKCGGMFVGEEGATEHAKATGHYDFGEAA